MKARRARGVRHRPSCSSLIPRRRAPRRTRVPCLHSDRHFCIISVSKSRRRSRWSVGRPRGGLRRTGPTMIPAFEFNHPMTTLQTAPASSAKFDNNGQYSRTGILRYEKIFGEHYISTGGHATTEDLCTRLGSALRPGRGCWTSAAASAGPRSTWRGPTAPRSRGSTWPRRWTPSPASGSCSSG